MDLPNTGRTMISKVKAVLGKLALKAYCIKGVVRPRRQFQKNSVGKKRNRCALIGEEERGTKVCAKHGKKKKGFSTRQIGGPKKTGF